MKLTTLICVATTMLLVGIVVTGGLARASFPGENGLIVFDTLNGSASQIYTIRPNGSDLRQLTGLNEGGTAFVPHWSADGRLIVYASDQTGNVEVYVMNADGSGKHQLTADSDFTSISPSFSRDGSTIVFSRCSYFLGTCDLALMRSDGTNIRSLVGGYWHHSQPVFSPHGAQIAFGSDQGGFDGLLWTVNAHGDNPQTVTQPQAQFGFALEHPDWSPDGERITFTGTEGGVFTIRSDGTSLRNLNINKAFAIFASYSPDGRKMVVLGQDGLSTMNADGSGLAPIPGAPAEAGNSDWGVAQ